MTSEIRLREVVASDLPIFFEHQREPEANRMAAFPARDWDTFQAHWKRSSTDETVLNRTILFGEQVAGNIVCWQRDGRRLVGYWLGRDYWGKGIATLALAQFVKLVPERPLFARVAKLHLASIRVLEKCGFTPGDDFMVPTDAPTDEVEEVVLKLGAGG